MKLTKGTCTVAFALLGLLTAGTRSWATEEACFTAYNADNGTVHVDASASTPSNTITYYAWTWCTSLSCTEIGAHDVTTSYTYPSPPPYEVTITLTVTYSNGDYITVSGDAFAWLLPVGPQPPASFTYCSTNVCRPDTC
jgi:hypothetical protein